MDNPYNLEQIAVQYHIASNKPDMGIEASVQIHEWEWISRHLTKGARVMDLGYGDGVIFSRLMAAAHSMELSVTLVEGSPSLVKRAQKAFPNARVVLSYFEEFSREKFDIIIASHVLEHVTEPVALISQHKNQLSRNGKLVGVVPNSESVHRRLAVQMGIQSAVDTLSPRDIEVGHLRVYNEDTLTRDLQSGGFQVLAIRGFFLKPFANYQLLQFFDTAQIESLISLGDSLPASFAASIGFLAVLDPEDYSQ